MDRLPQLWALHAGLPPFGPALRFINLHHEEGQDHHGTKEGENGDGLAYLLVVAARHDPCRRQWGMLRKAAGPYLTSGSVGSSQPHPSHYNTNEVPRTDLQVCPKHCSPPETRAALVGDSTGRWAAPLCPGRWRAASDASRDCFQAGRGGRKQA